MVLLRHKTVINIATALPIALLVMLFVAVPAHAAMSVRMVVTPSLPQAGAPATLSVQTLATMSQRCVDDPAAGHQPWSDWHTSSGQLDLVARATRDGAEPIDVVLTPRASDPTTWDGIVVFPASGDWVVRMVRPSWSQAGQEGEACAGARITVLVTDRLPATGTADERYDTPAIALVPMALLALLGAVGAAHHARRRR